ncbi:MAG TPA: saccharopine dehydrogenase NADP-binding domain-containing protein [Candidatus Polarisedimenticolia bacterium]
MRIVVLGGAGIIGRAIARDLADDREVKEIVIADLDLEGAQKTASALGRAGVTAVKADVSDHAAFVGLIRGAGAVINSVQYYFNLPVMKACLEAKVPYVDLGGLFHTTRKQLEMDADFRKAGLLAVLGLGSCPGIANIQARAVADGLDGVESVRIYNGATPDQGDSLAWAYSLATIFDEITQPPVVFRDGKFVETGPLGEEELYLFQEPIGVSKVHLSLHSEVATLPLTYGAKGIKECFFKISFFGYSEKALRQLQFLAQVGLASTDPVEVRGGKVRPRDVLFEVLKRAPQSERTKSLGFKDIITEVRGTMAGRPVVGRVETTCWPHKSWGISGGTTLVASPPAIIARWLAQGKVKATGVRPPEQVIDAAPFFKALEARGARTTVSLAETFPA